MSNCHLRSAATLVIRLFAVLIFFTSTLPAATKLGYVQIKGASANRIVNKSWAILTSRLKNTGSQDELVEIKVIPSFTGFKDFTVFSEQILVPAKSEILYESPIFTDSKHEFTIEMFVQGRKTDKQTVKLSSFSNDQSVSIVLNDSEESSFLTTKQLPALKEKVLTATLNTAALPDTWLALKDLDSIIIVRPDFSKLTQNHYQAILEYVQQGGTVIFADPHGTIDAAKTPLVSLLPVTPVRIKTISKLPALDKIVPKSATKIEKDTELLVTQPKGPGLTTLNDGMDAIIRIKNYGKGSARFLAFTLTETTIADKNLAARLVNKLIPSHAKSEHSQNYTGFQQYLDSMTGIKIPQIGLIQTIFLCYFVVLILTGAACIYLKRPGALWISVSVVSIIFSVTLVIKATSTGLSAGSLISEIKITQAGPEAAVSHSLISAFSGDERKLNLKMSEPSGSFASFPEMPKFSASPNGKHSKSKSTQARVAKSFVVSRNSGQSSLSSHTLRAKTPLQFQSSSASPAINIEKQPLLTVTDDGFQLTPWKLPNGISTDQAVLVLPNATVFLTNVEGMLSASNNETPPPANKLLDELIKHTRKSAPFIGLLRKAQPSNLTLDDSSQYNGNEFLIIPTQLEISKPLFTIPKSLLRFEAAKTVPASIMNPQADSSAIVTKGQSRHKITIHIPQSLATFDMEKMNIEFKYSSPNKAFEVIPTLNKGRQMIWGQRVKDGIIFHKNHLQRAFDSATSTIELTFLERVKGPKTPKEKKKKAPKASIRWTPEHFSFTLKGRLPHGTASLKY